MRPRRNRFQQRLRLLALRGRRIITEEYFHPSQRMICLEEKSRRCLKGHNSGLRTWFKTTTHVTFGANISIFLDKRYISFSRNFVSCFDQTRGSLRSWRDAWAGERAAISQWRWVKKRVSVVVVFRFDSPVRWIITGDTSLTEINYQLATWFGGLLNENSIEVFRHGFHGISGCHSLNDLKKPLVKTRPMITPIIINSRPNLLIWSPQVLVQKGRNGSKNSLAHKIHRF